MLLLCRIRIWTFIALFYHNHKQWTKRSKSAENCCTFQAHAHIRFYRCFVTKSEYWLLVTHWLPLLLMRLLLFLLRHFSHIVKLSFDIFCIYSAHIILVIIPIPRSNRFARIPSENSNTIHSAHNFVKLANMRTRGKWRIKKLIEWPRVL